jgi:hypothetical protein
MIGFRDYIRYAEKQLRVAEREIENGKSGDPYLIPSVILAWSAIESFVNNRLDEFDSLPSDLFAPHEKAFLIEKQLQFQQDGQHVGEFLIKGNSHKALSDKIHFLMAKRRSRTIKKGTGLWQDFDGLREVRNSLIHPRKSKYKAITPESARECIRVSRKVIAFISEGLGQKVKF